MKKKHWIVLVILVLLLILSLVLILNHPEKETHYPLSSLNVVASHGEYAIAIEEEGVMATTYALFKEQSYSDYKKIFTFPGVETIESRLTCFSDELVYFFGTEPTAYRLKDGSVAATTGLLTLFQGIRGRMDRVFGIYDNKIYYQYSDFSGTTYYGTVTLELTKVETISKENLPSNFQ